MNKKRIPQNIEILHVKPSVKHTKQGLMYFNIGYWIFCSSIFTNLPSNGVVRIQLSYDVYRETFYKTKKLKNQLFGLASSWTFIKLFWSPPPPSAAWGIFFYVKTRWKLLNSLFDNFRWDLVAAIMGSIFLKCEQILIFKKKINKCIKNLKI